MHVGQLRQASCADVPDVGLRRVHACALRRHLPPTQSVGAAAAVSIRRDLL